MSATTTQRLVPIRPSPHKTVTTMPKSVTVITTMAASPATLTPPKTGLKRKLEDDSNPDPVKCKRKINFGVGYVASPAPVAVARRNARERNRVKQVNNGFATLRQHIPGAAKAKKISKVETLKQAVEYIRSLQELLDENDALMRCSNSLASSQELCSSSPAPKAPSHPYTNAVAPTTVVSQSQYNRVPQYFGYYYSENVSPVPASVYPASVAAVSPTCSDAAASPTPSYDSTFSAPDVTTVTSVGDITCSVGSIFPPSSEPLPLSVSSTTTLPDTYVDPLIDSYEGVGATDDDVLLDAIALWQQCQ